jgi:geranylgeranyl diphosphate synthase, type I
MSLQDLSSSMAPAVELELKHAVQLLDSVSTKEFHEMLTFHMGWSGEGAGPDAQGKRIRPLLLLLTTCACGSDWKPALPAAAAVELIHNFSLVHDDIQDSSDLRRGRPTVWKKWGVPQAINVGDALFITAQLEAMDINQSYSSDISLQACKLINEACLQLSRGQYLDISYEKRANLSLEDYWPMISGKTAALLSTSIQVGALLAGVDDARLEAWRCYGHYLGLAFQIQDDYLGIWGDSALTGKSTVSDLVAGKKSLPVLYGLAKNGKFARRWSTGSVQPDEVPELTGQLTEAGAQLYTQQIADQMTELSLQNLRLADPQGEGGDALFELTRMLLNRQA